MLDGAGSKVRIVHEPSAAMHRSQERSHCLNMMLCGCDPTHHRRARSAQILKTCRVLAGEHVQRVLIHGGTEIDNGRREDSASRLSITARSSSKVRVVRIPQG